MKYRTKVAVVKSGRTYEPCSVLPDNISETDMEFLKRKGFLEPVDAVGIDYSMTEDEVVADMEQEEFDMAVPEQLKSPEEIRKIRSKKMIAIYANRIGFPLREDYEERSLKDLQDDLINFQEEQMADEGENGMGQD